MVFCWWAAIHCRRFAFQFNSNCLFILYREYILLQTKIVNDYNASHFEITVFVPIRKVNSPWYCFLSCDFILYCISFARSLSLSLSLFYLSAANTIEISQSKCGVSSEMGGSFLGRTVDMVQIMKLPRELVAGVVVYANVKMCVGDATVVDIGYGPGKRWIKESAREPKIES